LKNLLPSLLKKVGNTSTVELTNDDMMTMQQIIVAKAYSLSKQIRRYRDPKEFARRAIKYLKYKKTIHALFVVYGHKNMDTSHLYKPEEIRAKVISHLRSDTSLYPTDLVTSSGSRSENDGEYYISSKDMNKAMKLPRCWNPHMWRREWDSNPLW
jgi:hypothetical protein